MSHLSPLHFIIDCCKKMERVNEPFWIQYGLGSQCWHNGGNLKIIEVLKTQKQCKNGKGSLLPLFHVDTTFYVSGGRVKRGNGDSRTEIYNMVETVCKYLFEKINPKWRGKWKSSKLTLWPKPFGDKRSSKYELEVNEYLSCKMKIMSLKTTQKWGLFWCSWAWYHHAKCMMITFLWYAAYRAHTEPCELLLRCLRDFNTLLLCFDLFSRSLEGSKSWEVLAKIPVLWISEYTLKFINFWYSGSQKKWDLYLM